MEVERLHLSILLNLGETLLPINKNKYYQNNYSNLSESSAWRVVSMAMIIVVIIITILVQQWSHCT